MPSILKCRFCSHLVSEHTDPDGWCAAPTWPEGEKCECPGSDTDSMYPAWVTRGAQ